MKQTGARIIDTIVLETAITFLTVVATTVMAVSASIQAVRLEFDPFGATVLAFVTAVGGGTLRDLLIGVAPVFWIQDLTYLATAVPVGFVTLFLARRLQAGNGRRLRLLLYFDATGLALFTLIGIQVALQNGTGETIAIVLGCITGIAGGMMRDVLCGQSPAILKEDLYATISLAGGVFYFAARIVLDDATSLVLAFGLMIVARVYVVRRNFLEPSTEEF